MSDPYKFGSHNAEEMVNRGKHTYGSKVDNSVCECPVCFGGKRIGLFNCENCKGEGVVKNSDGSEVLKSLEEQEDEKNPTKDKKKVGPYEEEGDAKK